MAALKSRLTIRNRTSQTKIVGEIGIFGKQSLEKKLSLLINFYFESNVFDSRMCILNLSLLQYNLFINVLNYIENEGSLNEPLQ